VLVFGNNEKNLAPFALLFISVLCSGILVSSGVLCCFYDHSVVRFGTDRYGTAVSVCLCVCVSERKTGRVTRWEM